MKKLLTLLVAVLAIENVSAQVTTHHFPRLKGNPTMWQKIVSQQRSANSNTLSKTTNSGQKLKAISLGFMGIVSDSIHYSWSGNRTLEHFVNPSLIPYQMEYYGMATILNNPLDINYRYPALKADSIYYYSDQDGMPGLELVSGNLNTYNADDMLINSETVFSDFQRTYSDIFYNPADKIEKIESYEDTSTLQIGNYVLYSTLYCFYDNNNRLIKDSITYASDPGAYDINTYDKDANGLDTSVSIYYNGLLQERYRYTYTSTGLVQTAKNYYSVSNVLTLGQMDTVAYTGTATYPTLYQGYGFNADTIVYGYGSYISLNANNDVDTLVELNYNTVNDTWDSSSRYRYFYNSYDNADSIVQDTYMMPVWESIGLFRYYYDATTSVTNTEVSTKLQLYPNPASDLINLSVPAASLSNIGRISITDAAGRVVKQASFRGNNITVPITTLATGIYHLQYQSGNKQGTATFIKQ